MNDLVAWLTQILDEDEARLKRLVSAHWWHLTGDSVTVTSTAMADIAAKRAIIALHNGPHDCTELRTGIYPDDWPETASWGKAGEHWQHPSNEYFEDEPCPTLRLEASAYADRPGYNETWRP